MVKIKRLLGSFTILILILALVPTFAFAQNTVSVDAISPKQPGSDVTISGTTTLNEVTIKVTRPNNTVLYVDVCPVISGSYSKTFKLPADAPAGNYTVVVGQGNVVRSITFSVASTLQDPNTGPKSTVTSNIAATVNPTRSEVIQNSTGTLKLAIPAGAIEAATGATVKVTVNEIAKAELEQMLKAATKPEGFNAIGKAFELKAEAAKDNTTTAITTFAKPVTFEIKLSEEDLKGVTDPQKVGLFKLNADGTLTFVGGKVVDGKLIVNMYGFSRYVLAEVKIGFNDTAAHWAKNDIELMAAKYVVKGLPGGKFVPNSQVTRVQFALMLGRAMGLPAATSPVNFTDVKATDWFYTELMTAVQAGIVKGFEDGTFRPNDTVSREQMAVMIARALNAGGKAQTLTQAQVNSALVGFTDKTKISNWAKEDLALAVKEGIVGGQTATTLVPNAKATRAEAATMIARFWRK